MASEYRKEGGLATKKPGAILRQLRSDRGWTLAELSKRTGLPISTLSKVENDKMSLSYDKLARISEGLEVDIAQIFNDSKAEPRETAALGRRSITRLNEGGVIDTPSYNHVYHATELLNKKFVPIIGEIKHRSIDEFAELIRHEGEEYTFVLEGTVEFHCELYAPVILRAGESIYFDSSMGHAYVAVGKERCRVLSICAGAGMRGITFDQQGLSQPAGAGPIDLPPPAVLPQKRNSARAAKDKIGRPPRKAAPISKSAAARKKR